MGGNFFSSCSKHNENAVPPRIDIHPQHKINYYSDLRIEYHPFIKFPSCSIMYQPIYQPVSIFERRRNIRHRLASPLQFSHHVTAQTPLPAFGTVKPFVPGIYDQGQLGSCTANALAGAWETMQMAHTGQVAFKPSRLYIYYEERKAEGSVADDAGADVVDGLIYSKQHGACSESTWPYDISQFAVRPPRAADTEAAAHKISSYAIIPNDANVLDNIRRSILDKKPVLVGFAVYSSFESPTALATGCVPMPDTNKEQLLGGHEVYIVGYTDSVKLFTFANSWTTDYGKGGFGYFPYDFISNPDLAQELTTLTI